MTNQATPSDNKGQKNQAAPPPAAPPAAPPGMESRFTEVGADRFMFNPNKGSTGALVGYLINRIEMPDIERGKEKQEWDSLLVKTTRACKGIDRDGKVVDVPVGAEVITPVTFKLNDTFAKAAVHPTKVFEVWIEAKKKIDIGHGQTMWLYQLGVDKASVKDRSEFGLPAILGGSTRGALPPAGAGETVGASADENVPF